MLEKAYRRGSSSRVEPTPRVVMIVVALPVFPAAALARHATVRGRGGAAFALLQALEPPPCARSRAHLRDLIRRLFSAPKETSGSGPYVCVEWVIRRAVGGVGVGAEHPRHEI
jgi:hypothetical protein